MTRVQSAEQDSEMDTKWFEDFLAVVEEALYARQSAAPCVSQLALIKVLEEWIGASGTCLIARLIR